MSRPGSAGPQSSRRRGRRPAGVDTQAQIVGSARAEFADRGYDATSLRAIARRAGVDPALVHHYFDDKAALFVAAQGIPADPADLVAGMVVGYVDGMGERVVRTFLGVWDTPEGRQRIVALVGAAVTHPDAARMLREFMVREILSRVARAAGGDHPERRGSLVASQLIGLAMVRYVVRIPPLADEPPDGVVRWIAPTVQRYLTDPLD
jgi:AcrR family transcriptional regulator